MVKVIKYLKTVYACYDDISSWSKKILFQLLLIDIEEDKKKPNLVLFSFVTQKKAACYIQSTAILNYLENN